ncbi:MAG: SpoIIE family protein phosphatase [Coriobacteriia bacterium]
MTAGRRTGGLAARIVRVTLIIGVVTVVVAGTVAAIGAFRLAASQVAAQDQAILQFVEDQIVEQLATAETMASRIAASVATAPGEVALNAQIAPIFDSGNGLVDQIVIASRKGGIVSAYPSTGETASVTSNAAFKEALSGTTGFHREQNTGIESGLWLTRASAGPSGTQMVILIHIDLSPVESAVREIRGVGERSLLVLDSSTALIRAGGQGPVNLNAARFRPTGSSGGLVSITSPQSGNLTGVYTDLQGIEGVSWRVVVLAPVRMIVSETALAVAPSILVLLLGGGIAVFAAWAMSRRLVEPLRALEAAAYRAATGAYVKPITTSRDDEIGQVADAFNAVALRLNALHDLSQLLASSSRLDQVLDGILSAMGHIVGPGVAVIYLLDDTGRWLVPAAARGVDVATILRINAQGTSWLATSLRDADSVAHSDDAERLSGELPGLADSDSVAIVAPLVSGEEAFGVVVVLKDKTEPITEAEREMVRTFSAQAAMAVKNSRLFAVESESRRISDGLRAIAEQLVRSDGLEASLSHIETLVTELFGALSTSVCVIDRESLGLRPLSEGADEQNFMSFAMRVLSRSDTSGSVVIEQGEDVGGDAVMERTGAERVLVIPVAVESIHGAVLMVSLAGVAVGQRQLEMADAVSNEMALALENAYLYQRALARAGNLETIFRISQAVGSSLQVNVVLNQVLDVVQKILSADAVALMNYDARTRVISTSMARGAVFTDIVGLHLAPGEDVPGYVFSTGEPAVFRDLQESMGGLAGDAASHGMRSMLAVPMLARGRSIGVLVVFSTEPGAFSDEDISVLQTFASQAALAADTASMYSREHEVAAILQASILPGDLPEYDEIEAASAYEPAGADVEIGGDYYDLFRSSDETIWLVIADVCGKGVVAATKTSMIKYSVRSLVAAGLSPASVLGEVNRMVAEEGEPSDIVTAWVGRFDGHSGLLSWSSGGHPPAVVLRPESGEVEWLAPTGPLLGALADVVYGEETVKLAEGDVVVLYTDGVTEARNGNVFFGDERLRDTVAVGGKPHEIVKRLLTAVRRFGRGDLRDDVALLAIAVRRLDGDGVADEERSDT